MKKNKLIWLFSLLLCCAQLAAQNIAIRGTITDASTKEPLIGASILVKGTSLGTITDLDGKFNLSAEPTATLVINYLGYVSQEVAVKNQTTINILLKEESHGLDEIVVVGTVMKKSDLTGAVASVNSKVLEQKPVTSINEALQGRVAGVFVSSGAKPGDDATIKIRGINTMEGTTDPIYVVDGLVMDNFGGGFGSINLNDVESIEVLKDASATALYGSRASNGVILVTTKKGRKGEGQVSYDGWVGIQTNARLPKTMGTKDLFELRKDAAINSYKARYPNASATDLQSFITNRVMSPYKGIEGGGGYVFAQYEFDAYENNDNYNWLDEVTRTGVEHNHALSFSGGSDKSSYYLSFGYSNKEGMVKNLSDTKYTGRINADQTIKSWLKVGTNTSFTRTESEIFSDDGVYDKARGANPMLPISEDLLVLNYGGVYNQNYFNPLGSLRIENDRRRNRLVSANFININPMKGLNFRTSFSVDYFEESRFVYVPNDIQEAIRYSHDGEAKHTRDQRLTWQWDNSVSYETTIAQDHKISGLFSTSASEISRDYTEVTGRGFAENIFSYYNLGLSLKTGDRPIGSDFSGSSLMSYVGRVNYVYADKYYLTATARYDGSSKFAPDERWGLFPSISGAWNITEENFMKDQRFFDQMKLRVGYGSVGNQQVDDFGYMSLYLPTINGTYKEKGRRGTKDLTWEAQQQYNVGVDLGFLNNRIRLSADAFFIKNKDLLLVSATSIISGFSETLNNIGTMENKGIEFSVNAKIVETKDLQWNLSANIAADKNKVTELYGKGREKYKLDGDRNIEKEGNLFVGKSRNTIYVWRTGGIAQEVDMEYLSGINFNRPVNPGDLYPEDADGNKVIDAADRVVVGSPDPKFYGGFSTDVTYKGITLNAVFNYSYGAKKLSPYYESLINSSGRSIASIDLRDRWTPENTGAKFPRPIFNDPADNNSQHPAYTPYSAGDMDFAVQDASFLRLSTLSLAYTVPSKFINALKINNLRVYSTVSNVFCITPYKGYDPETGDWYPPTRMFVFGLNITL